MVSINSKEGAIATAIPALFGLCLAWTAVRILKNEKSLLLRHIELEMALKEKSNKKRREYLIGK